MRTRRPRWTGARRDMCQAIGLAGPCRAARASLRGAIATWQSSDVVAPADWPWETCDTCALPIPPAERQGGR